MERLVTMDVDLLPALAYFPLALVESVPGECERNALLKRGDEAKSLLERFGEDHPPVGLILAHRS